MPWPMREWLKAIHRSAGSPACLLLLAVQAISVAACAPVQEEDQAQSSAQDEESPAEPTESEQESPELSKLPSPKACKAFAPDTEFPDTNPNSPSYKKKLSPKDYRGEVSLWIPTFDCDC